MSSSSYKADEVKWGVKFVNIIDRDNADGIIRVDVTRLDEESRLQRFLPGTLRRQCEALYSVSAKHPTA